MAGDRDRIPKIIWRLQKLWDKEYNLRLGQMMEIAKQELDVEDLFTVTDDKLIDAIEESLSIGSSKEKELVVKMNSEDAMQIAEDIHAKMMEQLEGDLIKTLRSSKQ